MFEWAADLDMAREGLEAGRVLIEATVDTNVSEFLTLKAGLIVAEVVTSKGCVMVATCPPDFGVDDGNLLFMSQRGQ